MSQPFNEVKASSLAGVVLDCNLATGAKIGGGTATDNTVALNEFLATASATNPIKLILDGSSAVSGLVIAAAGHTIIEGVGWDSGIWIISGSNADPLNNGKITPMDPNTTPPASGANVILRNFQINGNRGNGTTGDSNSGNPRGVTSPQYWYCNINLANLNGVRIEDMYIYDAPAYSVRLNNCSDVVVANCTIINPNTAGGINNDCIHIDGPCLNPRIFGNYLNNNGSDDAIALNAPEGYAGLIDGALVFGNTFSNVLTAMRVYGIVEGQVGSVVFALNAGNVTTQVLALGAIGGFSSPVTGDVSLRSMICSGNTFSSLHGVFIALAGGIGDLTLTDCTWLSPANASSWLNCFSAGTVSSFTVNNCRNYLTTSGNNANTPLINAGAALTIKRMTINGFSVVSEQGQSYGPLPVLLPMTNITLSELYISALDYTNITALTDSYTNIGSISGQGWQPETNIQSKTAAYTLLPTDRLVLASTTAGSFAVTLPAKSYAGEKHTIKNTGTANTLTVTGTVDGSANPTLATLAKITVEYDGTHWWSI